MRVRFGLPLWALLFAVPVAVLAINCGPANLDTDNAVVQNDDVKQVVDSNADMNVAAADAIIDENANELSLDDGATDSWRRRGWGWGGYGYGYGYGGWGSSWWNPLLYSSAYYYPYYSYGWY